MCGKLWKVLSRISAKKPQNMRSIALKSSDDNYFDIWAKNSQIRLTIYWHHFFLPDHYIFWKLPYKLFFSAGANFWDLSPKKVHVIFLRFHTMAILLLFFRWYEKTSSHLKLPASVGMSIYLEVKFIFHSIEHIHL